MDPVSAIGLLASVATLIKVSKGALDLIKEYKHAPRDLSELVHNLEIFEEALRGFDRVLRSRQTKHNISEKILRTAINDGFATIKDLEKRLTQVYKTENSSFRRVRFVQHKSQFEALDKQFKNQCAQLHSFISLAHLETFLAVCNQHPQLLEACSTAVEEMASEPQFLEDASEPALPLISRYPSSNSSSITTLSLGSSTPSSRSSIDSRNTSITSTSFDNKLSVPGRRDRRGSDTPSQSSNLVDLRSTSSLVIRRACRHDCYCKCHDDSTTGEPKARSSRLNVRVFRENSKPKVECSDPSCAATTSQEKSIPVSFFKKAMANMMSTSSIQVRYRLNTYRMVPEGSNAMRYVKRGNLEKLKLAIQSGEATPWDTAPDGWSLLHTAAYARQLPTVQYLVELGAETEVSDLGARKPVDFAFLKSQGADATQTEKDIVQVFSKQDDYIDDYEFTPIHIAVLDLYDPEDSERPTLEELIDFVDHANNAPQGTNWSHWKSKYQKRSPLFVTIIEQFRVSAVENPDTGKIIQNLVDQKDRKFHWTPLHWASATGQADKMKILVNTGADPFIKSNLNANILHAAVESNALESLSYALEICKRYPDLLNIDQSNVWGESPLMMAAQGCLVGCVKLLLDAGADPNVRQENHQVALHYAGLSDRGEKRCETLALFCETSLIPKLDINAQDEDGRPPIFDFLDDLECMKCLIRHGAKLDLLDNSGNNLIHHICIQGESDSLESLLQPPRDKKLILTGKNYDGNTALIEALRHESIDCAMILLELDDVGDIVGQDGWAAVHYAAKLGDPSLLKAVLKHPTFARGEKTDDGKTARVVAMESGNWQGEIKDLLNRYNALL
ncbi:ankyrin repeat protein [Blastomyces dermatitidis ATCC 18188]|uniref:Ankyrin repeat protein n=1 Tax=Ajellomyces dermatitidis (strain ATCC 18188 / CBS 674.68) TaxID=653446 RepID=F2T6J2_AJEDA|nr:ankyrin repeat protein [Blastomyces dermatitidis ATCC 18188]